MRPRRAIARVRGVGALLVLALVLGCERGPVRVLLVGDSITVGRMSEPAGVPYAEQLALALGPEYAVTTAALSGTTSLDWRPGREDPGSAAPVTESDLYEGLVLPALPVELAVVLLGSNNAPPHPTPPGEPDGYEIALRELTERLLRDGAGRVVLMTPPPIHHNPRRHRRLEAFRLRVQAICEGTPGVVCGPDLFVLLQPGDFEAGNLHPNASGHTKIAEALAETIVAEAPR